MNEDLRNLPLGDGRLARFEATRAPNGMCEARLCVTLPGQAAKSGVISGPLRMARTMDALREWAGNLTPEEIVDLVRRHCS